MRAISQGGAEVLTEPVSDFMTTAVVTARRTDTYDRLMSEMTTHQFRHMPVVEMGRLIGIVSIELLYEGVGKRMPVGLDQRVDVRCRPDPVHAAGGDQMARAEFDPKRTKRHVQFGF